MKKWGDSEYVWVTVALTISLIALLVVLKTVGIACGYPVYNAGITC